MASKKQSEAQPPPTELTVTRDSFKAKLEEQIEQGKSILSFEIKNQSEFDQNQKKYYLWNDYNSEYLKQSFNNEYNEYKSSYDTCADWVGFVGIRTRTSTPEEILANHRKTIEKKIDWNGLLTR